MEVKEISIKNIIQNDNSRSKIKSTTLVDLMGSIKESGLLQPIGVVELEDGTYELVYGNRRFIACKKLGMKYIPCVIGEYEQESDVLVANLVENLHRDDVSDLELGRYVNDLMSDTHSMTLSEISKRLSLSSSKLKQTLRLYKNVPKEFRSKVKTAVKGNATKKAGTISSGLADTIITQASEKRLTEAQRNKLFDIARQDHITKEHIKVACNLIQAGATVEKAFKKVDNVKVISVTIPVLQEDWKEYIEVYGSVTKVYEAICKSLYGTEDGLVFQKPY